MVVVDVVRATAEATAAELAGKGIRSLAVVADITRAKDCERCGAAEKGCKRAGPVMPAFAAAAHILAASWDAYNWYVKLACMHRLTLQCNNML